VNRLLKFPRKLAPASKRQLRKSWDLFAHLLGRISGRYYVEDYIRVYPDGIRFNRLGRRRSATRFELNNFLNHRKFYRFAAQFVEERAVVDVGCGSGYGCALLKQAAAKEVFGADVSRRAIAFAKKQYSGIAKFSVQPITNMRLYRDALFDVAICSEVLEHIKEYGKEDDALEEIKRITRPRGVVVIGTPNVELLGEHGFSYDEIKALMERHFPTYCIFENAIIPFGHARAQWERRVAERRIGVVVTQNINLSETALPEGTQPQLKSGVSPGICRIQDLVIDTTALHNTHSWVVVARKE
jgi:2-polyprenyl-3-methyl-5-hydroxy-6-metoxy-1,4-benzoquinol methylase